jgi:hypothetical protein
MPRIREYSIGNTLLDNLPEIHHPNPITEMLNNG